MIIGQLLSSVTAASRKPILGGLKIVFTSATYTPPSASNIQIIFTAGTYIPPIVK